jgi:hypothetical protein
VKDASPSNGSGKIRERRRWPRLALAIPVFLRSRDAKGKEILEFATALNISAGGAQVAVRRLIPPKAKLVLEIPTAPLAREAKLPASQRLLAARMVRVEPANGCYFLGMKFARPLATPTRLTPARRKVSIPL